MQSYNYYFKEKRLGGLYNVATTIEQRDIDLVNSGNTWDVASLDMSAGGKLVLQGAQVNAANGISAYGGTGYEERAAYDVKETVNNVRTKRTGILAYAEGALSDAINRPLGLAARVDIEVLPNKMDVQTKDIDSTRKAKVTTLDGGSGSVQRSTGGDAYIEGSVVKGASVGTLTAGGKVTAVGAMDTRHVEKSTYSRSLMWQKTEGEGYINQTLHLPKIHGLPPGAGAYQGAGGVSVQLPAGSSVRTQIEALSGQPGLEYLGELGQRSDIDWKRVEVINQSLNINKQGLTPEGVIVVAIAVTIATAGTASAAGGAVFGAGTAGATAVAAGITTMATIAATSLINNGGNLGETLKELGSKDTLRAVAVSAATAGLTQGALDAAGLGASASTANSGNQAAQAADKISLTQKTGTALARGTVQGLSAAMAESAILGTSFEEALGRHLTSSLIASLGALGADEIGTHFDKTDALGKLNHKIAHAVLGCAMGAASADSSAGCAPGAVGAVIGELVAEWYGDASGYKDLERQSEVEPDPIKRQALIEEVAAQKKLIIGISELAAVGGTAVLLQSGAEQLQLAKMTANNAVANNFLNHTQQNAFADELNACKTEAACEAVRVKYQAQSDANNAALAKAQSQCESTGNCAERDRLYASGMPKLSGGLKQDNVVPDVENAMVLLELQEANAQSIKALINRPLSQEVVRLNAVSSFDDVGNVTIDPARFVAAIDNQNGQNSMALAMAPMLFLPGPEDVVAGAVLATKAGQKLAEVVLVNGQKVWKYVDGTTARVGSQEAQAIARARIDNNFNADNDAFTLVSQQLQQAKSAGWLKPDGKTWWPPENGAVPGSQVQTTLPVGTKLDRYGGTTDKSTFLAPADTPMSARALKDVPDSSTRDMYEVLKPLPVQQSNTMPWFDQPGMGLQYDTSLGPKGLTIQKLVEQGYLKKVSP